jgi:hypothetical protein
MRFRKLRIAWSVVGGLAFVALIVLWARSYSSGGEITFPFGHETKLVVASERGRLSANRIAGEVTQEELASFRRAIVNGHPVDRNGKRVPIPLGPNLPLIDGTMSIPHWAAFPVILAFAAAPWMRWRFSLRTVLIATTLVAVVMGLIVWAAK